MLDTTDTHPNSFFVNSTYETSLLITTSQPSAEPTPSSPETKKKGKNVTDIVPPDNEAPIAAPVHAPPRGSSSFRSPKLNGSEKSPAQQFKKGAARQGSFEDDGESYDFSLRHSFAMKDEDQVSEITSISRIDGPSKLLRAKTSAQLLSMVTEEALGDQQKISSFISLLKAGEMQTKAPSEFRQRRLTYSQQTVSEQTMKESPKPAPKVPKSRTTIFASSEIGVMQEKKPPFPHEVLGTYSCHGIEPSEDEEDGIHEKINQDRGCIVYPYNSRKDEALFMVLDGHGEQGDKVSEFVMRQIVVSLEKDPLLDTDPVKALKNAYITTNTALLVTDIRYETSGCTCVTVYCKGNKLYVANVGDSRAVMAYEDKTSIEGTTAMLAKNLTRDHKPDDPDEKARIEAWGGFVCPPHEEGLSARVYLEAEFRSIGLAMSRSIGDHAVKHVGVIPEPEIKIFDIQPEDRYMIMASDGVWEFISSQVVSTILALIDVSVLKQACIVSYRKQWKLCKVAWKKVYQKHVKN